MVLNHIHILLLMKLLNWKCIMDLNTNYPKWLCIWAEHDFMKINAHTHTHIHTYSQSDTILNILLASHFILNVDATNGTETYSIHSSIHLIVRYSKRSIWKSNFSNVIRMLCFSICHSSSSIWWR